MDSDKALRNAGEAKDNSARIDDAVEEAKRDLDRQKKQGEP